MSCCEQMVDPGAIPNREQRAGPGRPAGKPRWQQFTPTLSCRRAKRSGAGSSGFIWHLELFNNNNNKKGEKLQTNQSWYEGKKHQFHSTSGTGAAAGFLQPCGRNFSDSLASRRGD